MNDFRPSRSDAVASLQNDLFDVVIIGGGATGAGAALDAASRGLKVALIEKNDFASGTSSKSTKLIHGGVRYLEQAFKSLDFGHLALVKEALAERKTLLTIAPHLSRALPLLIPLYKKWQIPYYYAGLFFYDMLAGFRGIGRSKYMSVEAIRKAFPSLKFDGMQGGIVYYDGQFNDARMNVEIALTAQQQGAVIANYISLEGFTKEHGCISGCNVIDTLTNKSFIIRTRNVINATGPFSDVIRHMDESTAPDMVRASAGSHIMVNGKVAPQDLGMLIPQTTDGRVVFVLPWEGMTMIGTTDEDAPLSEHPQPTEQNIRFLLDECNYYLHTPLTRDDVLSAWTGLRPLVSAPDADTKALSRSHVIVCSDSGLISIMGGKWTTYRSMAEDVVDKLLEVSGVTAKPCTTKTIGLTGSVHIGEATHTLKQDTRIDAALADHLLHNYGGHALEIVDLAGNLSNGFEKLADGYPYIRAEIYYAIYNEMAQTIDDILARRTRLASMDSAASLQALPVVAECMADVLNWDEHTKLARIEQAQYALTLGSTV